MTEEKVPNLQEQINIVNRTLDPGPLIVFVTCILSGISLAAAAYLGQPWYWVGTAIASGCTAAGMFWARHVKEQYKKLVEQLCD